MEDKYIVAIEIGSSKIRGALASIDSSSVINVLAVEEEHLVGSVRYGQVKNIEEVSNKIDAIRRRLENNRSIQQRHIAAVYVGLSGNTVMSVPVEESLMFDTEVEITNAHIDQLRDRANMHTSTNRDNLDIVVREYVVDNETVTNATGRVGSKVIGRFNLIQGQPGLRSNIKRVLPDRLGLDIRDYIVSPLALASTVLSTDEKQLGCVLVDFGAETTTVVIYKGGVLHSLVTLPMGSRNINRDIMSLNYLDDQAENYKRSIGILAPQSEQNGRLSAQYGLEHADIPKYISARASEIAANIIAQIEFAGLKPADLPSGFILVGGGARLKGFSEMLQQQSKMKVRMGTSMSTIRYSDTSISADDAVDVVSLIVEAASRHPEECLTPMPTEDIYPGYGAAPTGQHKASDYADDDDETSRIGMLDNDDDLLDDYDDRGSRKRGNTSSAPRVHKPKDPNKRGGLSSLTSKIAQKLGRLMKDNEDDEFEDYEDNNYENE